MTEGGHVAGAFLARSVIEGLRRGDVPSASEALSLHTAAVIGGLRQLIEPADLEWLLPMITKCDDDRAGFFISLLAAHTQRAEVQAALQDIWDEASPYIRSVLMWRMIDDPNLPRVWHQKLFEFALAEWGLFQRTSLRFFGGTDELVIAVVLERYCGREIPESKKWAYLCSAASAEKCPGAARAIVQMGLGSSDEFVREVAARLLVTLALEQ